VWQIQLIAHVSAEQTAALCDASESYDSKSIGGGAIIQVIKIKLDLRPCTYASDIFSSLVDQ
jgi:hypothetical protein